AIATADTVATPTEDGRLQYGDSELRLLTEGDLSPAAVRAFNALMLKRSQRRELARETWRHVSGRRDVVPTVEVRAARRAHQPLSVTRHNAGAASMSELRARHRRHKHVHGRRHLIAQSVIACVIAGLLLPTVAGPVLGSLVALATVLWTLSNLRL